MRSLFLEYAALSKGNDEMLTWDIQLGDIPSGTSHLASQWQPFCDHNEPENASIGERTPEDAARFVSTLATILGVSQEIALPAYEDVFYFLWEEGKVPNNLDPAKMNLDDPLERQQLAHLLEKGIGEPVGYVLPLAPDLEKGSLSVVTSQRSCAPVEQLRLCNSSNEFSHNVVNSAQCYG